MTRPSPQRRFAGTTRLLTAAAAALMVTALFATTPAAQAAPHTAPPACSTDPCDIGDAGGPLTHVYIGSDLSCQVLEGTTAEYTDCGTFVAQNGTLYGPPVSTSSGTATAYTPVSQTVTGDGSLQDPNQVTTNVHAGKLAITEIDTYAAGQSSYKTRITLRNDGPTAMGNVRLYRAADCALGGDPTGFGAVDTTLTLPTQLISVSCTNAAAPGAGVESWVPNSVKAHYFEGAPADLWSGLGTKLDLPDTCVCPASAADNAVGISWFISSIGAGATVVRGDQTNLSPTGTTPLGELVKADNPGTVTRVDSYAIDGYTITIDNPTTSSVTIESITDHLLLAKSGERFTYVPGSTTGDFGTADPAIGPPGTLTWSNSVSIGPRSDLSLHFKAQAPGAGGVPYDNAASATASAQDVSPTGPSARIHVTQAYQLTVHKAGTGSGTVSSTPAGITCLPACTGASKTFTGDPSVKLTATKSLGSVFAGWTGDCSGTGVCQLKMSADHDVTAAFDRVCTNIAYVSGNDIMTIPAAGGLPTTLVHTSTGANYQPAWSPNCAKIAFTSTRGGIAQIYIMRAGGTTATRITGLTPSSQPTWSADGSKIAFTRVWKGKPQIYVVASGGGTVPTRITTDGASDTQPDWSPIGPRIVFTSTAGGRPQLYSILSSGTGLIRLTSSAGTNVQAAWSPTAARLLFISTRDGNPEVYVMNANGSHQIRLTYSKSFIESHPAWSPTGSYFAFTSNSAGNADVFTRTLAGANRTDLTTSDPGPDTSPAWSS